MPFRFRKASCVIVGTFNMYILRPQWLAKHEIIDRGSEVGIETNLTRPGFRFHFQKHQAVWTVAPDRIAIESQTAGTDCGRMVAKVLRVLPETPLFALGNNMVYKASRGELAALLPAIRDFPRPESPRDDEAVAQQTFHFAVKRSEHEVVNLRLSIHEDEIELACNVHRKFDEGADANQAAIDAAEDFFQDRDVSEELARHFFGVTISHDANDV